MWIWWDTIRCICIYIYIHTRTCLFSIFIYLHTVIHTCIHTYVQTDRQPARQPDSQTARQPDRQTDRQTHIYIYIHTYVYIYIDTYIHPTIWNSDIQQYDIWVCLENGNSAISCLIISIAINFCGFESRPYYETHFAYIMRHILCISYSRKAARRIHDHIHTMHITRFFFFFFFFLLVFHLWWWSCCCCCWRRRRWWWWWSSSSSKSSCRCCCFRSSFEFSLSCSCEVCSGQCIFGPRSLAEFFS